MVHGSSHAAPAARRSRACSNAFMLSHSLARHYMPAAENCMTGSCCRLCSSCLIGNLTVTTPILAHDRLLAKLALGRINRMDGCRSGGLQAPAT